MTSLTMAEDDVGTGLAKLLRHAQTDLVCRRLNTGSNNHQTEVTGLRSKAAARVEADPLAQARGSNDTRARASVATS